MISRSIPVQYQFKLVSFQFTPIGSVYFNLSSSLQRQNNVYFSVSISSTRLLFNFVVNLGFHSSLCRLFNLTHHVQYTQLSTPRRFSSTVQFTISILNISSHFPFKAAWSQFKNARYFQPVHQRSHFVPC